MFEHFILQISSFLTTSSNQFGFKRKHSTDQRVFLYKLAVSYYVNLNSPVFRIFLDASKAFDRVNHYLIVVFLLALYDYLEKQHGSKMTDDDYAFYKDQTSKRVGKCVDAVVPSTSADIQFLTRSRPLQPHPEPPTCSSVTSVTLGPESALDYLSDSSSTNTDQTQSSAASEFVSQSMPYENQNRMIWSTLQG